MEGKDIQNMIAAALQQAAQQANNNMGQAGTMQQMQAPQMAGFGGIPNLTGWSVPVEQEINGMVVTLYLNFPANTFGNAANIIMQLANSGLQVRAFQKSGSFGGGSSWGSRGGSYNRGGGYGGGYGRRY